MRIETDLGKVAKFAKQCEEKNWAFRSFLKQSDIPGSRIDATVHELYREVSTKIDCRNCANCCKVVTPRLTSADIKRLSKHAGMTVKEFQNTFTCQDEKGEGLIFKSSPCPFLKDNQCSVYDVRPRDCRSFPHLHKKDFASRLIGAVQDASICPIVYNVLEELKRELWRRQACVE